MKTIGEIKKYKMCATPNVVSCPNKKKGECSKCIDITDATNWLLKELKPKSGTLLSGVMNNDYAAFLLTKYASQFKAPIQQEGKAWEVYTDETMTKILKEEVPNTEQGKETAIDFSEWVNEKQFIRYSDGKWNASNVDFSHITTSELFTLYLNRNK